jgi:beta-lactamase regulating signal transducer with metallopeptidase domain
MNASFANHLFHTDWSAAWSAAMWRASWQGALAVAVAWLLAQYCTFLSPRVVCWVWRAVCLKMLVALAWAEPISLAMLPAPQAVPAPQSVASIAPAPITSIAPVSQQAAEKSLVARSSVAPRTLLFALWLTGACAVAIATLGQFRSVRKLVTQSAANASQSLTISFLEVARGLGIGRVPDLRMSPSTDGPFLAGIWHPTIVLPTDSEVRFSPAELRGVLAHELAHLKRRDLVWNVLPMLVQSCFYFHPITWLMSRGWGLAQESACDELVLQARRASSADYARLLVKCACQQRDLPYASLAAAGVLGNYRNLERRIMAMAFFKGRSTLAICNAAIVLTLVAVPATVPWRLVAQEPTKQQPPKSVVDFVIETPEQIAAAHRESTNQLMRIGLALHNYHNDKKSFPPAFMADANGKSLLSWRVALLPYLEGPEGDQNQGASLYKQFDLTQPWDSAKNKPLVGKMPEVFRCPASKSPAGTTVYLTPRADFTVFPDGSKGIPIRQITDGTSNTIAVVEVNDELAVPWTRPDDWKVGPDAPTRGLGGHFPQFILSLFIDGSVHALPKDTGADALRALLTRNGREIVSLSADGKWHVSKANE